MDLSADDNIEKISPSNEVHSEPSGSDFGQKIINLALGSRPPEVTQASTPEELLDKLETFPVINVTQINETAYLFVLQPAGSLSSVPGSFLATDVCETRYPTSKCDCPMDTCLGCAPCEKSDPWGTPCCGGDYHKCCTHGHYYSGKKCIIVECSRG